MTPSEAQVLLSMAATVDNRKPDEDAAKAWAAMLDDLRFDDCRIVVIEHYKKSNDWLMPATIRAEVKRIREKRLAETPEPTPPPELTPQQTIVWLRQTRAQIADGTYSPPALPEATDARVRDLRALASTFPQVDDE